MALITVESINQSRTGSAEDDVFVLKAMSSSWPRRATALFDGGEGKDTLDLRNIFSGSAYMSISDNTFVEGAAGIAGMFSIGDFDFRNFEVIYGNETSGNRFLLQTIATDMTLHGGAASDSFVGSFDGTGTFHGYGGDDSFEVRGTDTAYGGDGNDSFDLYESSAADKGAIYGGAGRDALDLSFGWTVDLAAKSAGWMSYTPYAVHEIEDVVVSAWRGYATSVRGTSENNSFWVADLFNDGSVGVYFDGRAGNDSLSGSNGNDSLYGGSGADTLIGGAGDDQLFGGKGRDVFVFAPEAGHDVIADFNAAEDRLDLSAFDAAARAGMRFSENHSGHRVIHFDTASSVTFTGISGNAPPIGGVRLSGSATQGSSLSLATEGLFDIDGMGELSYQWLRDGTVVAGAEGASYTLSQADVGARISARVSYVDGFGTAESVSANQTSAVKNVNDPVSGTPMIEGEALEGATLIARTESLGDLDGLGPLAFQWLRDGGQIAGATGESYTLSEADVGAEISLGVSYLDGHGTRERVNSGPTPAVKPLDRLLSGTSGDERLSGGAGNDVLHGGLGSDTLIGLDGNDTLYGGPGEDDLQAAADLRDILYGGNGDDLLYGGYGNDELRGDAGDDVIFGGYGVDTLIGGEGNDSLSGGVWSDLIYGGEGDDFLNGGFGHDRLNGGAGADTFYHLGIADHGADWIQDYNAAEGDVLMYGATATASEFLVQRAFTQGAGLAGVGEVFITHKPSGVLLWALVDGDAQASLNVQIGSQIFDLLA